MKKPLRPDIKTLVDRLVRPENYEEWLATPNTMLGGRAPQDVIDGGEGDLIRKAAELALEGDGS